MNIAKMLAQEPIDAEVNLPHVKEESAFGDDEDDFNGAGEEAAVSEILDAFHSKDAKSLRIALKSFMQLCRDGEYD